MRVAAGRLYDCSLPIALATLVLTFAPGRGLAETVSRSLVTMGTTVSLLVSAPDRAQAVAASEAAVRAIEAAAARLGTWQGEGAIRRLNATPAGQAFELDAATAADLSAAVACAVDTGGAFDPTVGALVSAWGLRDGGRVPERRALQAAQAAVGWSLLDLRGGSARRLVAGLVIEEGGFGKGAALDAGLAALAAAGATAAVLDAGGQVAILGRARIDVAHPSRRRESVASIDLDGGHVATSGNGEQTFVIGGRRPYGHILDPRTGRPAPIWGSVTVRADTGLRADCLATGLYVMGPEAGLRWANEHGLAALFVLEGNDGRVELRPSGRWPKSSRR